MGLFSFFKQDDTQPSDRGEYELVEAVQPDDPERVMAGSSRDVKDIVSGRS